MALTLALALTLARAVTLTLPRGWENIVFRKSSTKMETLAPQETGSRTKSKGTYPLATEVVQEQITNAKRLESD